MPYPRIGTRALQCCLLAAASLLSGRLGAAHDYVFTTLAGDSGYGAADGPLATARFYYPRGVAVDRQGNVYIADGNNNAIRRIGSDGRVTTIAGVSGQYGTQDGTGSTARFLTPQGIAVDRSGNVYVTERQDHLVRRITPDGRVTTLAGNRFNSGSVDGAGTAARFSTPRGLATDAAGNVYIADAGNHAIRRITPAGVVSTIAGLAGNPGSVDGTGSAARFREPSGIGVDASGNIYVSELQNHTVRKITPQGEVSTLAGLAGTAGPADGTGAAARFFEPAWLSVDGAGNVYVTQTSAFRTLRRISPAGVVTTLVPDALDTPQLAGVAADEQGRLFAAEHFNHRILTMPPGGGALTAFSGTLSRGAVDGVGAAARFNGPTGLAVDDAGNVYVSDGSNHVIRRVAPDGRVTTLAGAAGQTGTADGPGPVARFNSPAGIVAHAGNIYVADHLNHAIRRITPDGAVTTLAGMTGERGNVDGTGGVARFNRPRGVSLTPRGDLLVTDYDNAMLRRVALDGAVTTVRRPTGLPIVVTQPSHAVEDSQGRFYVASANHSIRTADPAGVVATLAGSAGQIGFFEGVGTAAGFNSPVSLALDAEGNLLVLEAGTSRVRLVTPGGVTATIAGSGNGNAEGGAAHVRFNYPNAIAFDREGNLYVADGANNTIRKGVPVRAASPGRLRNLSVFTAVTEAEPAFTLGAVIRGPAVQNQTFQSILIRAAGPSLAALAVPNPLADPKLELFMSVYPIEENDNWGGAAALTTVFDSVGAFRFVTNASRDAALYRPTTVTENYTVQVSGVGGATGQVIAEIYDATPAAAVTSATPRLTNLSVLKRAGADTPLTVGFVIGAGSARQVLIRAVGPSLAPLGVPNHLADPRLTLFRGSTVVTTNDDWAGNAALSAAFTRTGAFPLTGPTSRDAALVIALEPGNYSAQVEGAAGESGTALVEVYELP